MPSSTQAPRAYQARYPIKIRELDVLHRRQITPRMTRITLGGPNLDGFESHAPDEHVKLVFPDPDSGVTRNPTQDGDHLDWPHPLPPNRSYTVRRYDAATREIDIDFVVHPGGLASEWSQNAELGSRIWVAGPRPGLIVPPEFGFQILLGDETALPAIARWLQELPADVRGIAAVEIHDDAERQNLSTPTGIEVTWLSRNGAPAGTTSLLGDFARGLTLPTGEHTYLFAQGEAGCVKPVRRWARAHGFGKGNSDIGGYWRRGTKSELPSNRALALALEARHRMMHALGIEHD